MLKERWNNQQKHTDSTRRPTSVWMGASDRESEPADWNYLYKYRKQPCVSVQERRAILQKCAPVSSLREIGMDIVGSCQITDNSITCAARGEGRRQESLCRIAGEKQFSLKGRKEGKTRHLLALLSMGGRRFQTDNRMHPSPATRMCLGGPCGIASISHALTGL